MTRMLWLALVGVMAVGAVAPTTADAGDRRSRRAERYDDRRDRIDDRRDRYDDRRDGYFRGRDVVVIREYYRPVDRRLPPGLAKKYRRSGYLPPGWARRMQPVPVFIEREMRPVPRGYFRGIIDGRAVVYDRRGFILDVAVVF